MSGLDGKAQGGKVRLLVKSGSDAGGTIIECERGKNLLKALTESNVPVDAPCGGGGRCGKCRAYIDINTGQGEQSPAITGLERELLPSEELEKGMRLLCRQQALYDCEIELPSSKASVLTGFSSAFAPNLKHEKKGFGVAIDIGTTTVAAYLADLSSGEILAVISALNAQKAHGADVITRAAFSEGEGGLKELSTAIRGQIAGMSIELCAQAGVPASDVAQLTAVGNTIMLHMLMEESVSGIVRAPFTPSFTNAMSVGAKRMGLPFENAAFTTLPCVSGYVGADTVAAVIACGMHEFDGIALLLDIGTNGEIVLGGKHGMVCCSAAAGPAFEGAHISCGSVAKEGAISEVFIEGVKTGFTTIGGKKPTGICGSGLLDAVAGLVRSGAIDETGAFDEESPLVAYGKNGPAYNLAQGVYINQADVRQVQLAKSAIASGAQVLLNHMKLSPRDVQRVYLAGGFGNYMRSESAIDIGLLDKAFAGKITQAGNAAGAGAYLALLFDQLAEKAADVAENMRYIELSQLQEFNSLFVDNMFFEARQ
ncbi:MAG: ASKHA domain-containing protein [Christensenellales bacterium]|jgi:uncharacterized 2Fe-2S/4Fe-4S cluster protein (DUF4445 family)